MTSEDNKSSQNTLFSYLPGRSTMNGLVLGTVECIAINPLWVTCLRTQMGKPLTLNPYRLYAGVGVEIASMAPTMAIQVGLNKKLNTYVYQEGKETPFAIKGAIAFGAGAVSGVFRAPFELVKTVQQQNKSKPLKAVKHIYGQNGLSGFFKGMPAVGIRESLFALSFLASQPLLINWFCSNEIDQNISYVLSSAIIGSVAAISTQPFDTIKVKQMITESDLSLCQAGKKILMKEGIKGFQTGGFARMCMVIVSVGVMGLEPYMSSEKENKSVVDKSASL